MRGRRRDHHTNKSNVMKIISLQAENVKKLVAVEIKPDGNLVEITGRNGQGKTSVLDSIWWALAGTKHIQSAPIRKGATEARIRLDLGELIVSRRFWKGKGGSDESSISVENAEGARYPSPQKMIDALLGELSFDPLAFARMDPKDQFNALKRFVPGVDFEAIANSDKGDRERRQEINRLAKQELAAAQLIIVPAGTPAEPVDEEALVKELQEAGEKNAKELNRKNNRASAIDRVAALRADADDAEADIKSMVMREGKLCEETVADLQRQILELQTRIETARATLVNRIREQTERLSAHADARRKEADDLQAKIDAAAPLADPIDTTAITERINQARLTNANVRKLEEREKHRIRHDSLEQQSEEISVRIEKRQADKVAAIAAAKIPVPGIEFGDGEVLLNSVPFEQASDAEQLTASVRIAMALNPKLRVIRIRDGSLLDTAAMQRLAELAEQNDMQVWIERVDSSGKIGFVLEDGHVRRAEVEQAEAVPA